MLFLRSLSPPGGKDLPPGLKTRKITRNVSDSPLNGICAVSEQKLEAKAASCVEVMRVEDLRQADEGGSGVTPPNTSTCGSGRVPSDVAHRWQALLARRAAGQATNEDAIAFAKGLLAKTGSGVRSGEINLPDQTVQFLAA